MSNTIKYRLLIMVGVCVVWSLSTMAAGARGGAFLRPDDREQKRSFEHSPERGVGGKESLEAQIKRAPAALFGLSISGGGGGDGAGAGGLPDQFARMDAGGADSPPSERRRSGGAGAEAPAAAQKKAEKRRFGDEREWLFEHDRGKIGVCMPVDGAGVGFKVGVGRDVPRSAAERGAEPAYGPVAKSADRSLFVANHTRSMMYYDAIEIAPHSTISLRLPGDEISIVIPGVGQAVVPRTADLLTCFEIPIQIGAADLAMVDMRLGVLKKVINHTGRQLLTDLGEPFGPEEVDWQSHYPHNHLELFLDGSEPVVFDSAATHCTLIIDDKGAICLQEEDEEPFEAMLKQFAACEKRKSERLRDLMCAALARVLRPTRMGAGEEKTPFDIDLERSARELLDCYGIAGLVDDKQSDGVE